MPLYKIIIDNRDYTSWTVFDANTLEAIVFPVPGFNPAQHKLFTNDVFNFNNDTVEIEHSSTRNNINITAVLILADNKTYGRECKLDNEKNTDNGKMKKMGKLLYKCIPDDIRIPIFLVPYEIKQLGFSKVFTNIYVTINYKEWTHTHPIANLSQNIGTVDILNNFYEYQLYCKSLNTSLQQFNKDTNHSIKTNIFTHDTFITSICDKYPQIEDRTSWKTFTIDPASTADYDDAFSIKTLDNEQTLLSIYIANVTIWMDSLNLWTSFSKRISTIYLPDRKRPMLPTILSECLCSLQQHTKRFAFVIDIIIDKDSNILSTKYSNCLIKVFKNFSYEEPALLSFSHYRCLFETTKQLSQKYKYINYLRNSHDVVAYLMIFMNHHSAKNFIQSKNGILRTSTITSIGSVPEYLPEDVNQFITTWNNSCCQYIDIETVSNDNMFKHELLDMDAYIHITSPIRRLVDLLNIIKFQENNQLIYLTNGANEFYNKWIRQIDYINVTMRAIKKIQNDCSLLHACDKTPEILDKIYDGFCFDKLERADGLYQFIVFLPELRLSSKITIRENLDNYQKRQYKLFIFNNEDKFKKKIRLHIV